MRIIVVIFTLLAIFMISVNLMVENLKERTNQVNTKITKWYVQDQYLHLGLIFETNEALFFQKDMFCKTFDRNKKELEHITKTIKVDLKKSIETEINMGKVNGDIRFIDCAFIKEE